MKNKKRFRGTRLITAIGLIGSELCMMSSHRALCCRGFCNRIRTKSSALAFPNTYKHSFSSPTAARRALLFVGITGRDGWGKFSNVSSKCQLKITRALEKVESKGTFFFSLSSVRLDTTMFIWPSCCLIWWDLLCQFLNTLGQGAPVNINERHPWANTRSSDKQWLSSQSLSIWIFSPAMNRMSRLPQGTRGKKKACFALWKRAATQTY